MVISINFVINKFETIPKFRKYTVQFVKLMDQFENFEKWGSICAQLLEILGINVQIFKNLGIHLQHWKKIIKTNL